MASFLNASQCLRPRAVKEVPRSREVERSRRAGGEVAERLRRGHGRVPELTFTQVLFGYCCDFKIDLSFVGAVLACLSDIVILTRWFLSLKPFSWFGAIVVFLRVDCESRHLEIGDRGC